MPIVNDLEIAKKHFEKINITNVAIEKVPFIKYDGLTEKQCVVIQALAKEVLLISKEENDCNNYWGQTLFDGEKAYTHEE